MVPLAATGPLEIRVSRRKGFLYTSFRRVYWRNTAFSVFLGRLRYFLSLYYSPTVCFDLGYGLYSFKLILHNYRHFFTNFFPIYPISWNSKLPLLTYLSIAMPHIIFKVASIYTFLPFNFYIFFTKSTFLIISKLSNIFNFLYSRLLCLNKDPLLFYFFAFLSFIVGRLILGLLRFFLQRFSLDFL